MLPFFRGRVARGPASHLSHSPQTRLIPLAAAGLVAASAALPCFASLGRAPSAFDGTTTVHQARTLAAATGTGGASNGSASYSVSTTTLAGGTTVREYVGADGVVF